MIKSGFLSFEERCELESIVRCLLYQAALVASNHNPALKIFAKRLRDKGKPQCEACPLYKVVLIAVARKLLIIANTLIKKNQVWRKI